ncbi:MAG TPA: hypothetical protein VF844_06075 [Ktedonobacteraceae bacterium]
MLTGSPPRSNKVQEPTDFPIEKEKAADDEGKDDSTEKSYRDSLLIPAGAT